MRSLLLVLALSTPAIAQENETGAAIGDDLQIGQNSDGVTWQRSTTPNSGFSTYSDSRGRNCQTIRTGSHQITNCTGGD